MESVLVNDGVILLSSSCTITSLPQVPPPCEQQVEPLKAEIQVLNKVISDQQRYIQELHRNHGHLLEQIPSVHLGAGNVHRGVCQTGSRLHQHQQLLLP